MRTRTIKPNLTFTGKALAVAVGVLIAVTFVAAYAALICLAWNYAIVALFHLPTLHFWQVLALMFLLGVVRRMLTNKTTAAR